MLARRLYVYAALVYLSTNKAHHYVVLLSLALRGATPNVSNYHLASLVLKPAIVFVAIPP